MDFCSLKVQFKFLCERTNLCNSQNKSCYVYLFKSVGKKQLHLRQKLTLAILKRVAQGKYWKSVRISYSAWFYLVLKVNSHYEFVCFFLNKRNCTYVQNVMLTGKKNEALSTTKKFEYHFKPPAAFAGYFS